MVVWTVLGAVYLLLDVLTAVGSRRRGNDWARAVVEGGAWPSAWIAWFVWDNRAAGRSPFQGHDR